MSAPMTGKKGDVPPAVLQQVVELAKLQRVKRLAIKPLAALVLLDVRSGATVAHQGFVGREK